MATISSTEQFIARAKRRLPTVSTLPGLGYIEQRLRTRAREQVPFAEPPRAVGSNPSWATSVCRS